MCGVWIFRERGRREDGEHDYKAPKKSLLKVNQLLQAGMSDRLLEVNLGTNGENISVAVIYYRAINRGAVSQKGMYLN